ncbi:nuclear transport factor 2 family protein [Faunimonas sp. B44]|uniref:nuclear transport factor 2 family protein n=1 Tax=Faunimonas sp. B44 TaxID=3461493 RepID=UPI004044F68D
MNDNDASDATRRVVSEVYAAFRAGDLAALEAGLADDIDWAVEISADIFPFGGVRRGREAVMRGFRDLLAEVEHVEYEPQFTIVEGDKACVFVRATVRMRDTGRTATADLCDLLRVRDGKVVWFRELFDTLSSAEAIAGAKARFA